MTPKAYIEHRQSIFYPKTDEPVNKHRYQYSVEICPKDGHEMFGRSSSQSNNYSMLAESRVIEEVRKMGIPTPTVKLSFLPGRSFQLMEKAWGQEVGNIHGKLGYYQDLGRLLALLHTVKTKGFGPINPFESRLTGVHRNWRHYILTNAEVHSHYLLCNALISGAEHHYINETFKRNYIDFDKGVLLHGDLSDKNIFGYSNRISAIIDWEDAMSGDPIFDLAYWATFHPEEIHKYLLDEYYKYQDKPDDFHRRFWTYFLRISVSKMVQNHKYGVPDLTKSYQRIELALTKGITP